MKIDYRKTTEWKSTLCIFPKALETVGDPWRSNKIVEYSGMFERLEHRSQQGMNGRVHFLYRRPGSTWDFDPTPPKNPPKALRPKPKPDAST